MILRPTQLNRVANTGPGLILVVLGVLAGIDAEGDRKGLVLLVALGVGLAVRGYNLSVSTRSGELTVHGFLRTRTIQRAEIAEITDSATVVWIGSNGRRHRTPIWAFNTPTSDAAQSCQASLGMPTPPSTLGARPVGVDGSPSLSRRNDSRFREWVTVQNSGRAGCMMGR